jgi:hypothetical protein
MLCHSAVCYGMEWSVLVLTVKSGTGKEIRTNKTK